MFALSRWYQWCQRLACCLRQRRARYILAWFLALAAALQITYVSWTWLNNDQRLDGNDGHTTIDFASQWLMGRMLVRGEGKYLYERDHLREALREAFPRDLEGCAKAGKEGDADELMIYLMGSDDPQLGTERKVGGPLYPPINALVHWPVGLFDPQTGYRIHQIAQVFLAFLSGLAVSRLSDGRIWTPIAATLIFYSADFYGNQILGQNGIFTMTIVLWGWVLLRREQEVWGGVVWGLLAYKPVWAMSFFFVLLLTRRWRGCLAMLACGAVLAGLTLPLVEVHSWLEWKQIAAEVAQFNRFDENWIGLSRTIFSIPRRYLVDFKKLPGVERVTLTTELVCWAFYLLVIELSVRLIVLRGKESRVTSGPGAAFVLSSAWLCCFQFMYYDTLIAFAALIVLFLYPREFFRPRFLHRVRAWWQEVRLSRWFHLPATPQTKIAECATGRAAILALPGQTNYGWLMNPFVLLPIAMIYLLQVCLIPLHFASDHDPYAIYCVLIFWLWCGWLWTRE
jgi:hypothetical protein